MSESQLETSREHYALLVRVTTRWSDYDMLGHLNNVEYYRYFESAVLTLLHETGLFLSLINILRSRRHLAFR